MFPLCPIFARYAGGLAAGESAHADSSNSRTDADEGGALTLEMRDNPLNSFMRRLDRLMDRDPAEAFRLARQALSDRNFDTVGMARLEERLVLMIDALQRDRLLGPDFTRSALGLVPVPLSVPAPVAAASLQPRPVVPEWQPAPSFGMPA